MKRASGAIGHLHGVDGAVQRLLHLLHVGSAVVRLTHVPVEQREQLVQRVQRLPHLLLAGPDIRLE